MTELLKALSKHPAGIQITMYPNRVTIDLGYGTRSRHEGMTLETAAIDAAKAVLSAKQPVSVAQAIEEIVPWLKYRLEDVHCPEGKW